MSAIPRIRAQGKRFVTADGAAFPLRGVTYGTFAPRGDGERFPERERMAADLAAIAAAGFTAVRTYLPAPDDCLELAAAHGLRLMTDVFWMDWRYLVGESGGDRRRLAATARAAVRAEARRLRERREVLAVSLGNEIPADAVRWFGTARVAGLLNELAEVSRHEAPDLLVTYANYPTAEYLPLDRLDFLTFNVFLERRQDLRRYLNRLHHLAGDRPLVVGELGCDARGTAAGETAQARLLDEQLETAVERGTAGTFVYAWTDDWHVGDSPVAGWHFGLTRADRTPKPALEVVRRRNGRTLADLRECWPGISVVVCAYNAAATLHECLAHTTALDYPDLEIVVVDDGSTDATAAIARRHPRVRLVEAPHAGLSTARNLGMAAATRPVVAYLDADAYPDPEWLHYLALALEEDVGGAGGPNLPPPSDPPGAHQVAHAPGGPVHVLLSDDRAEHIPGCNMAFRREVLEATGGFDPIYTAAGDDVDLCWRILDRGEEIGFHPAALVWHHRRPGVRPYLRQQRGYGRAEALVEARHPDRFTALGSARWKGRIYDSFPVPLRHQRVYRGLYGSAAYQSVYRGGGHGLDIAHQAGVPLAAATVLTAPLALLAIVLAIPALAAVVFLAALAAIDIARFRPPPDGRGGRPLRFRLTVALLHMLQPLVRAWGRMRAQPGARRGGAAAPLGIAARRLAGGVYALPADRPRVELAAQIVALLRRGGARVTPATGWEDHDAVVSGSTLVAGELLTTAHITGTIAVGLRLRLRGGRLAVAALAVAVAARLVPPLAVLLAAVTLVELGRGVVGPRARLRRVLRPRGAEVGADPETPTGLRATAAAQLGVLRPRPDPETIRVERPDEAPTRS